MYYKCILSSLLLRVVHVHKYSYIKHVGTLYSPKVQHSIRVFFKDETYGPQCSPESPCMVLHIVCSSEDFKNIFTPFYLTMYKKF